MIYKQPVTETQRKTALQNALNEAALANLKTALQEENHNRQHEDSLIRQDLSATRAVLNEEIQARTSEGQILRADLQTEIAARKAENVNIRAELATEIENRNTAEGLIRNEINSAVDNEKTNRAKADADLKAEIDAEIDAEAYARVEADNNLRATIAAESNARTDAINETVNKIGAEAKTRADEDAELATEIENERKARESADNKLSAKLTDAINDAISERNDAIDEVKGALTAEAKSRADADAEIKGSLAAEIKNRADAVQNLKADLQGQINNQNGTIATLASKNYVDGEIAGVAENLSVFTSPTATADGKQGQVPAPKKTSKLEILTNKGWRPADDTTLTINTLPSQAAALTYNTASQSPTWANFDTTKLKISSGETSGVDAKTYTVYFKPLDLYMWSDTLDQREKPVTWKIDVRRVLKPSQSKSQFDYGNTYDFFTYTTNFDSTYVNRPASMVASNVGVHSYDFTLKSPTNATWIDSTTGKVTLSFEISKIELSQADSTGFAQAESLPYNGKTQTVTISNFNPTYHTVTGNTGKDIGNYTAYVSPKNIYTWYGGGSDPIAVPWKIDALVIPAEYCTGFAQAEALPYNGQTQTVKITNFNSTYHTITGNTGKDIKSYTAYIAPSGFYTWQDGTTTPIAVPWEIVSRTIPAEYSSGFAQSGTLTFNGQNQSPTISKFNANYHVISGNVQKNAGTYTATITPAAGYEWSGGGNSAKSVSWKIDPKALNQPKVTSDVSFGYDGESHSITTSGYDATTMTESGDAKTQSAVGDYTLKYNLRDKNNYVWAETGDTSEFKIPWNIGLKRLAYPAASNSNPFVFSEGEYKDLVVTGYDSDFMTSEGTVHEINAGTYQVKFHLTHPERATWIDGKTADFTLTWEIQRKKLTAAQSGTFAQSGTLTFNGESQSPAISKFDASIHKLGGTTTASDAGTFTATVAPLDNYAWNDGTFAAKNVSWTIGVLQIYINQSFTGDTSNSAKLIATLADKTFNDAEQTAIASDKIYYYGNKPCTIAVADAFTVTGTTKATNAGDYTFTFTLKYSKNIQWYLSSYAAYVQKPIQFKWTIARKKLSAVTFSQNGTLTYNGQNQSVDIKNFNAAYHVLSGDTTKKAAGNYTAKVSPAANYCWNDSTIDAVDVAWTIGKKVVNVPVAAQTEFAYDGKSHTLDFGTTYVATDMTRSGDYSGTAAKNYTVKFALKDKTNTRWNIGNSDDYEIPWSIGMTKIDIPTPGTLNFTYAEGTVRTPTFTYDSATVKAPTGDVNATNAGNYVITFELADSTTTVWTDGTTGAQSFNWKIDRQKLSGTLSTFAQKGSLNYTGDSQTVEITNFNSKYHALGGDYSKTDAGTYSAVIQPLDNYCWSDGKTADKTVTWTINKIKIAKPVINGDSEFLFDNKSHAPTVDNFNDKFMTRSGNFNAQTNTGDYQITFALKNVNNTVWNDDSTGSVTLDWRIYKISVDKPTQTKTEFNYSYYSNTARAQTFTSYVKGYDETVMLQSGDTSGVDAGTYKLKYTLLDKLGYYWADGSTGDVELTFTINRASVESNYIITVYRPAETYNGNNVNILKATAKTYDNYNAAFNYWYHVHISGVGIYNNLEINRVTITGETTGADAGVYTVIITPTANYQWKDTKTQEGRTYTWEIARAEITAPTVDSTPIIYNENAQSPTLLNFDPEKMEIVSGENATNAGDYQIGVKPKNNWCWAADESRGIEAGSTDTLYLDWTIERQPLSEGLSTLFYHYGSLPWADAAQYVDKGLYTCARASGYGVGANIYAYDADYTYTSGSTVYTLYITHPNIRNFYKLTGDTIITNKPVGQYVMYIAPADNYTWHDGSIAPKIQKWYKCPSPVSPPYFSGTSKFDFDGAEHTVTINKNSAVTVTASTVIEEVSSTQIKTSATAAGTYTLTFKCPEGKCWVGSHSYDNPAGDSSDYVLTWTIGDTNLTAVDKPTLAEDTKTSFVYDGNEHSLEIQGFDADLMEMTGNQSATNAGTYTVIIKPKTNVVWNGGGTAQVSFSWEITRKPLTTVQSNLKQGSSYPYSYNTSDYSGKEQTVAISQFNALYHEKVSGATAINAGDYICVVRVKENYCWSDGTTADKEIPWRIRKSNRALPELSADTFTYNGKAQAPTINTTNKNLYDFTGDELSQTDCGNYSRTIALKDTANFQWKDGTTEAKTVTWKITPKQLTIPTADGTTFTYNGDAQGLTITGFNSTTMDSDGTISEINAGDYSVTYKLKDKKNYRWADDTTTDKVINWTIKRALIQPSKTNIQRTFTGKELSVFNSNSAFLENLKNSMVDGILPYNSKYFRGELFATNAGTYTFYEKPDENHYWSGKTYGSPESIAECEYTWTIEKAPCEINLDAEDFFLDDSCEHNAWYIIVPVAYSSPSDGKFSHSNADASIACISNKKIYGEKNGTTTITIKQAEGTNYLAPPDKTITVTVARTIQTMGWDRIQTHTKDGTLLDYTDIGDSKTIALNGKFDAPLRELLYINGTYRAVLIGYDHNLPTEADNCTHTAHFAIMKNAADTKHIAFCTKNYGEVSADEAWSDFTHWGEANHLTSWSSSNLRTTAADGFREMIEKTVNYGSKDALIEPLKGSGGSDNNVCDKVWTFSTTEMGDNLYYVGKTSVGKVYEYFADGNNPTFYRHDNESQAVEVWTREARFFYTTNPSQRLGTGAPTNKSLGFIPCFAIGG